MQRESLVNIKATENFTVQWSPSGTIIG